MSLRKYTQTITLRVEFYGQGETLAETPGEWEWWRAQEVGGHLYDAVVEAAGPVELVDRHDFVLRFVGGAGAGADQAAGWHVYDNDVNAEEPWRPRFVGRHADALRWIAERGGAVWTPGRGHGPAAGEGAAGPSSSSAGGRPRG